MIYQIFSSFGTLLIGFALWLGYKKANVVDAILAFVCLLIGFTFFEVKTDLNQKKSVTGRFREVAVESANFIKTNRKARWIIVFNSFVGAVSVLILFFLQALLPKMQVTGLWLGVALLVVGLGGAAGAKAIILFSKTRYRTIGIISLFGIMIAFSAVFSGNLWLILIGAFIGAFSDNFLQVRSDVVLNDMVPSNQRATLISINSFAYSVVMIVLSPIFGVLFS